MRRMWETPKICHHSYPSHETGLMIEISFLFQPPPRFKKASNAYVRMKGPLFWITHLPLTNPGYRPVAKYEILSNVLQSYQNIYM